MGQSAFVIAFVAVLSLTGCAADGQGGGAASPTPSAESATPPPPSPSPEEQDEAPGDEPSEEASPEEAPAVDEAGETLPDEVMPTDWLTIANGVVLASFEGDEGVVSASDATRIVDGDPADISFATDTASPSTYTFELPAATTFDRFAVPAVVDAPGNGTFFGAIEIAGSSTGPDEDFEVLVDEDFVELPDEEEVAEFAPATATPVRWVRITLSGALFVDPEHDPGRTVTRFTELIGTGTQEEVPLSEGFNGVWELAPADNPDASGLPAELKQDGATVAGCIGFADVTGSVTGNVVRLNGVDRRDERPSVYLLVATPDGELRGFESTNGSVSRAKVGRIAAEGTTTECSDVTPEPPACGSIVYVNFDVDSAQIRPDSSQVLDDLASGLAGLDGAPVVIEGHTSTEGSEEYNQDLSERRAAAVVAALADRGLATDTVSSVGRGETEPLVDDPDETSRAINRRVEIECG